MITGKGILFSHSIRQLFPFCGKERRETRRFFFSRFAGLESLKNIRKTKSTPAHQRKFSFAPSSPFASASAAHTVKGRFAFRSASLHSTLDFLARLRLPLHTTAAPKEISFQGRRYIKAAKLRRIFPLHSYSLSSFPIPRFSGASFPLSAGGLNAFPASVMLFPSPRLMLSGSRVFTCPALSLPFPQGCLFVRRHPGGPAYPTYIRAAARYALGLARGFAPLTPVRPAKGSGQAKGERR
jgi:hypothetical protein